MTATMCLALNVFFEARNEPRMGQLAIMEVTLNRVASKKYPNNVCDVVWQKKQFSWTHDGKHDNPNRMPYVDRVAWLQIQELVDGVVRGTEDMPITGATMYHADYVSPYWADSYTHVASYGSHLFYE